MTIHVCIFLHMLCPEPEDQLRRLQQDEKLTKHHFPRVLGVMKVLSAAVCAGHVALSDTAKGSRDCCIWAGGGTGITHRAQFEVPALSVLRKSELVYV